MFKRLSLLAVALLALAFLTITTPILAPDLFAQASSSQSAASPQDQQLLSKVESYLRNLFSWGPEYKVNLGPVTPADIPDLLKIPVSVDHAGQNEKGTVYVTKDARFMFRGEIRDMTKNPFADNLAKITTADSPSAGPTAAKLTVVEFSDFECPHCQEAFGILKEIEPEFPQVRWVFKNFPLEQLHPWAMSAALAGRCVYKSSNAAFLKFQDSVFTNQSAITPDNAWDMLTQYAFATGASADALHSCMTDPGTKSAVEADIAEGKSLDVESTPTFFINGRPFQPSDKASFEQILRFALSHLEPSSH
ncbi:MAG TPA: thioredoxin domain-containing protein [Candidatus Acidoferrales bacterium]|nr:thioredoxin domain-containing protein [Candidatus Acidoferrales bacterium]